MSVSDPVFSVPGLSLGFDWHSSGLTTTLCGALERGSKRQRKDLRLFICGGKGQLPQDSEEICLHAQKQPPFC